MQITREQVWSILQDRNVDRVEVEFSGGGDEGSVDEIFLYSKGVVQDQIDEPYIGMTYVDGKWVPTREMTQSEILATALVKPVYDEYGSFAGEFSVYGKVVWDVESKTVKFHQEIQSGYDYSEFEV